MGAALGWLCALVGRRARGQRVKGLAGISGQQFMAWACTCGPPDPFPRGEPLGTGGVE